MSDLVWTKLIDAVIWALVTLALAYMAQRTKAAIEKTAKDAATKVETVKDELVAKNIALDEKLVKMDTKLEVVHKATNSIVAQLVASERVAGHAEGVNEERSKNAGK